MNALIDEAVELEEQLYIKWDGAVSARIDEIWTQLRKPYDHLYSGYCLGDTVGPGWWPDLLSAMEQVNALMAKHQDYQLSIRQIKEKFGGIRFYYDINRRTEDADVEEHDEDWTDERQKDEVLLDLQKEVYDIVRKLEAATEFKCETCGQPGEPTSTGWIKVLCNKHKEMRANRFKSEIKL